MRGILNITAALKCRDRVREISIWGTPNSLLKRFAASMRSPFPVLISVQLFDSSLGHHDLLVLSDSFLGGFAPRLRSLDLRGISFPAPQKLLLSATDLVTLRLERIPNSGYISPEEIVACLSTLTKLKELALEFRSPLFHSHQTSQDPVPRTIFPALTSLRFQGAHEYLEDLLSRTDLPFLNNVYITLTNLATSHAQAPLISEPVKLLEALYYAEIGFGGSFPNVALSRSRELTDCRTLKFRVLCSYFPQQLPLLSQLCNSVLPPLPNLEHLYIHSSFSLDHHPDFAECTDWLELLRPFTSVENLHLSKYTALRVASALRHLSTSGERVTEVLPALRNIFLHGPRLSKAILVNITQFVAAIRPSGRSVSVRY